MIYISDRTDLVGSGSAPNRAQIGRRIATVLHICDAASITSQNQRWKEV